MEYTVIGFLSDAFVKYGSKTPKPRPAAESNGGVKIKEVKSEARRKIQLCPTLKGGIEFSGSVYI
jgi:hypothetical protein